MPTIEERLAALEAKLAALTETTPTTYYEHQYSGEEIDNAVSRALPNGAIDQSVGTFVRPNLLDNAYFLNPVDQRGGYIVPKGVNYYKVDGWVLQGPIPETVRVDYIDESGSARFDYGGVPCYVPKDGGYVRGYTGNGYSVDRWILNNANINVKESELSISSVAYDNNFSQKIESKLWEYMVGKTITISFLVKNITGRWVVASGNNKIYGTITEIGLHKFTDKLVESVTDAFHIFSLGGDAGGQIDIIAAKLELGPTQTLAHQENGQWVLNEVPEEGEQLRRCQMDLFKIGDAVRYTSLGNGIARDGQFVSITIPTPVTMRTMPVLIAPPVGFSMRHSDTIISGGANFSIDAFSQNSIMLKVQSQVALTPGDMWEAFLQPGGSLVFSAEL